MEKTREEYEPRLDYKPAIVIIVLSILGQIMLLLSSLVGYEAIPGLSSQLVGGIFLVLGLLLTAKEKKDDITTIIGYLASSVICALAITSLSAGNLWHYLMWLVIVLISVLAERYYFDNKRYKKVMKYWEARGIAKTDIDYKGKVQIGDEVMKVRIMKNAIKAGTQIKVVDIYGFMLVVEPVI